MKIPKCIAFTGLAGSGKDTCADYISEKFGHQKIAFADPLKDKVSDWARNPLSAPDDLPEYINELVGICHRQWQLSEFQTSDEYVRAKPYSPELRNLLQFAGTEYFRAKDSKYWIKSIHLDPNKKYVISDMRFPDECSFAKAVGAATIGIYRPDIKSNDKHASEKDIHSLPVDYWVKNEFGRLDQTFRDLIERLQLAAHDSEKLGIPLVEVGDE